MDTQCAQILKHLKKHKTITPLEALRLYGVFRLGARIFDLRSIGHLIDTKYVKVKTRRRSSVVASYRLVKASRASA